MLVVESETFRSPNDSHWAKNIYLKEEYNIFLWYKIKFPFAPFVSLKFGLCGFVVRENTICSLKNAGEVVLRRDRAVAPPVPCVVKSTELEVSSSKLELVRNT